MTEIENGNTSNGRLHAMYIVLITLLIGGLVYTNLVLKTSKETIVVTTKQRDDVQALKAELDKKYSESLQEIESYRAENAGLDSLLTVKEHELTSKKAKIDALLAQVSTLKTGDATKMKLLADAQALIKQMEDDKMHLQTSIDSLVTENKKLYEQRDSVTGELTNTLQKKQEVDAENKKIFENWILTKGIKVIKNNHFYVDDSDFPDAWHINENRRDEFTLKLFREFEVLKHK